MSEYINNREYRQKVLKDLITQLHEGKTVEEVKEQFAKLIEGVSATEISMMETELIREGMPLTEVQRLCDVHAAVFKGSIEEIHSETKAEETMGHPIHTMKEENKEIERLIKDHLSPLLKELKQKEEDNFWVKLVEGFERLWEIDKHYLRKENLLFPYMEKYGITAPPKVMWGVDDEIRDEIKEVRQLLSEDKRNINEIIDKAEHALGRVEEMIFKEENILFPMVLDTLDEDEWLKIARESDEIGFCIYEPKQEWKPSRVNVEQKVKDEGEIPADDGYVRFDTGILSLKELEAILNSMPVDITFVDKDGAVKYFSQGKERIFPRTKAVIGRLVQNCHPPASVHIVEQIVEDLKSGKKDHEDFWIRMGENFIYIRYFAVRDTAGEYLGVLEFTQNIKPIQALTGEKRLASED
ncbi:MAG: domain S-box protein [Herbinix sp.]|jgi:DUF438 domain-containing protein|nr:domain S-box protein [Herbinix sp.]